MSTEPAAAHLSYIYVEEPLRRRAWGRFKWETIIAGMYGSSVAALLLMALAVPLRQQLNDFSALINPLVFQPQQMVQTMLPCHLPQAADPIQHCLLPSDRGKTTIYVVGDSHASNHVPSIERALSGRQDLEMRYLVEWGFILSLVDLPKCADHSSRPCLDDSLQRHLDFFARVLNLGDVVVFSWSRDKTVFEGPLPRQGDMRMVAALRSGLLRLREVVTLKGAELVLVDDIPKPCNNSVSWPVIYVTGRHEICASTVAVSKSDRRYLSKIYKSLLVDGVHIFDPHDALCHEGICGIYDPETRSLIYAENSPHFTPSRPAPLAREWELFFAELLPSSAWHADRTLAHPTAN